MEKKPLLVWIKFGAVALTYLLWVIWLGNYWLLPGLAIIFDVYISKKVPWSAWKKPKEGKDKPEGWVEWVDAIVFALVAVSIINIFLFQNYKIPTSSLEKTLLVGDHLFVSKVSYGPRVPNTPLAFPLVQNTLPIINTNSYFEWPNWDYHRLTGFGDVKRGDIVVFNFPAGDTVAFLRTNPDYYNLLREGGFRTLQDNPALVANKVFKNEWEQREFVNQLGRQFIANHKEEFGDVLYRPVDRRDNYVKRCVALPGDTFSIVNNQIHINGKAVVNPKHIQHNCHVITDGTPLNSSTFEKLELSNEDINGSGSAPHYYLPLTADKIETLKSFPAIKKIVVEDIPADSSGMQVFPFSKHQPWSRDNYGPIWMPKKGVTITLTLENLALYERIITSYEGNRLKVKEGVIYINDKATDKYTFAMNYYFMLGDNRQRSADSRYWGFVPEDHIVGKPIVVWLSIDPDKGGLGVRWNRFFTWVKNE